MTSKTWESVRILFEGALAVSSSDRPSWIEQHAPDARVASEVEELISCYEQWPDFLEEPPKAAAQEKAPASPLADRRFGPWRLVREVGRGGMGVVWEAVRDDQTFQQRVALKLLPMGLQTSAGITRFVDERQILASLSHPGIARLLDGGSTDDGSPYLVMEYIEGERLDDWLTRCSPSFDERLRIFLSICSAVDYAHRHLVVHRDLKPANILVTPEGMPVLLDFGLARLLAPLGPGLAQTGTRLFTPRFASPEQIHGQGVTTATDVYSLGVLLYLMLTGKQPHADENDDSLELLREICTQDPSPPSVVQGPWRKMLRGELDAIVLQCLRKDPEERYNSVRGLAEDLTAWRDGRPVQAHRPGWIRRTGKLIRRNKVPTAALTLALLFLVGGAGVSLWQVHQAREERARAEVRFLQVKRLAHSVLFDLHDAIQRLPGSTSARRLLVQTALDYLRELEASEGDNRDLDWELAAAYMRVGEVQASMGRANTGDSAGAIQSQLNARRLAAAAARAQPADERGSRQLLDIDIRLCDLYEQQGNRTAWKEARAEIDQLSAGLAARHPQDRKLRFHALWDQAYSLNNSSQSTVAAWHNALAAAQDAALVEPRDPEAEHYVARCYRNLGDAYKNSDHSGEALENYRQALLLDERRAAADPSAAQPKMDLYWDLVLSGWTNYHTGHAATAVNQYERAARLLRQVCASDPDDFLARLELAKLLITAVPAYQQLGREPAVVDSLREALQYLDWARARDPHNEDAHLHQGWALLSLADARFRRAQRAGSQAGELWQLAADTYAQSLTVLGGISTSAQFDDGLSVGPMAQRATAQLALCRSQLQRLKPKFPQISLISLNGRFAPQNTWIPACFMKIVTRVLLLFAITAAVSLAGAALKRSMGSKSSKARNTTPRPRRFSSTA